MTNSHRQHAKPSRPRLEGSSEPAGQFGTGAHRQEVFSTCEPPEKHPAAAEAATRLGETDATRVIAGQYTAGVDVAAMRAHHDQVAASLLSDARTPPGRAYARAYAATGSELLTYLSQDQAVARGRSPAACAQQDGSPHPDPLLASRGWQADHGIWQRTGAPQPGQNDSRP